MTKVAVGIIYVNGKILICQRKESARYPLKWEFPGGKVELNENEIDCLKREIFEELSINAEIGKMLHKQEWEYNDAGKYSVDYFIIDNFEGELKNNVFKNIAWCNVAELKNYDMLDGNREVVELLNKMYA